MIKGKSMLTIGAVALWLGALSVGSIHAQSKDKCAVKVPGGLAFQEFKGYESWQMISVSQNGPVMAVVLGNPEMIEALRAGIPGNGNPFPDGAKMAKIYWTPKKNEYPGHRSVPNTVANVDFMVKDAKRFADSGGWGYRAFEYEAASDTFRPGTMQDYPPQSNDAKRGFGHHTIAKSRDYVFTEYQRR